MLSFTKTNSWWSKSIKICILKYSKLLCQSMLRFNDTMVCTSMQNKNKLDKVKSISKMVTEFSLYTISEINVWGGVSSNRKKAWNSKYKEENNGGKNIKSNILMLPFIMSIPLHSKYWHTTHPNQHQNHKYIMIGQTINLTKWWK